MRTIISILIGFMTMYVGLISNSFAATCSQMTESMTPEAISDRIKPAGMVSVEGGAAVTAAPAPVALAANAGEERYKSTCAVCHATGVAGAPKFRDSTDWKSRMAAGIDGMLKIAITGKGAMPPKGTCMQCSDEELKKAIQHMLPK